VVGGTDPVAVDAVCARVMRMDPARVRHLVLAAEAGLGTIDEKGIALAGESVDAVRPETWEFPPLSLEELSPHPRFEIVDGKPCSNCIASVASCLHGYLDKRIVERATHDVSVLVGAKAAARGTGNEIAIGNRLERYRGKIPFVSGCPPPSDAYLELVARGLKGAYHREFFRFGRFKQF
jgi:hypothetical protein